MNDKFVDMPKCMADKYETADFVASDPVQFPRRYSGRDAEVSGFITSWLSFGNRKAIIGAAEMRKWMLACYIVINAKKGVSSVQLAKFINVTQKTAWFMLQRIQNCFNIDASQCLNGEVEVDETYIGGLNKNRHSSKKVRNARGRSCKDKVPVFGMLQREGFVIAKVVSDTKAGTLLPIINDVVCPGSTIFSDEWYAYKDLDKNLYDHGVVYHKKGAYVIGDRHTNTIEGFWGHLKRTLKGVHHWVSRKHLQRYVDSSAFRYNTKHLSECERFDVLLQNIGHRLRYLQLN